MASLFATSAGRLFAAGAVLHLRLFFHPHPVASILAEGRKTGPGNLIAALRLLGLGLLILAFARPQLGNTTTEIEASGIDILLAVDVSGSMEALDFTLKGKAANRAWML